MKSTFQILALIAFSTWIFASCERHDIVETKVLHGGHGGHHNDDGHAGDHSGEHHDGSADKHGAHDEAHKKGSKAEKPKASTKEEPRDLGL